MKCLASCLVLLLTAHFSPAQKTVIVDSSTQGKKTILAGAEYKKGPIHRYLWGNDYRKEWTTPVTVPVLNLDSAFGGLKPLKMGGGRQTRSLHLLGGNGKRYMLRMVNKTYLGALPLIVQGTFIEKLANDQVATNHPYAALAVPKLSEAAGIYHTQPRYVFVPFQKQLGEYNSTFANSLCLLEERPDETQTDKENFGQPQDIVSTEKMLDAVLGKNDHMVDQEAYIKTRLFDMFLGDWGRHEDNWRWALFDSGTRKIYKPIPKDRDQTFARFEGKFLNLVIALGKFKELQSFDDNIENIKWYNYPAYKIDSRFTNSLSKQDWIEAAQELQKDLTNKAIEKAIQQMPAEISGISGEEIILNLKSRRDQLIEYAAEYYAFLAKNVSIPGSKESEWFEVKRINDTETSVSIYRLGKTGEKQKTPVYSRIFLNGETKEIRLYGVDGNDRFTINGNVNDGIKIRVIGGPGKDTIIDQSYVGGWGHKTKIYDNPGNEIEKSDETKVHLSNHSSVNRYEYDIFKFDTRGVKPVYYYNSFYRFYVGLGYSITKDRTRDGTFKEKHSAGINYSLVEKSFHPYYKATFSELIGNWNFNVNAGFDAVRRFNFFGLGNESVAQTNDVSYYWLRMKTLYGGFGIDQSFLSRHNLRIDFLYNGIKVLDNEGGYISLKGRNIDPSYFNWKHYAGTQLTYSYLKTNDRIVPTKGTNFQLTGSYIQNIKSAAGSVVKSSASLNLYFPLVKSFSLAVKTGAATLWGNPEFHQYNNIGGFYTLRGFWRYRFYGRSMAYNQNEVRWLPDVKGYYFSGRIGLVGFFDQGRIWHPKERSNKWHYGYGGGIMLVPFNKVAIVVTYGFSEEGRRANIRLGKFL